MREPATLMLGDCLERMKEIADASVDCIIADPPYPEILRAYGRMTEPEWHTMMRGVIAQGRRVLKPSGSAVFILQPNSERVGLMRLWLWDFVAWAGREWNLVQDVYWWNIAALPVGGAITAGLLRGSLKACVWLGPPDCHRDQDAVLWDESQKTRVNALSDRCDHARVSGWRGDVKPKYDSPKRYQAASRRGGVTPFNVLPMGNGDGNTSAGSHGHGAGTPINLCDWWVRYLTPEGGTVCDPFMGSGTVGLAALKRGRKFIGIERDAGYYATAQARIRQEIDKTALLTEGAAIA